MAKPLKMVARLLAEMRSAGLIGEYAIGGAYAFIYYAEPFETQDLDVFAHLPVHGRFVDMTPIYAFFAAKGYPPHCEHVVVDGLPMQLLPAPTPLVAEAVGQAREIKVDRMATRIFTAEHAVAIALQTNRPKDHMKIAHLLETARAPLDEVRLLDILTRHRLLTRWRELLRRLGRACR